MVDQGCFPFGNRRGADCIRRCHWLETRQGGLWSAKQWCSTGPLLRYKAGVLEIEDLNPEMKTYWRMTRLEILKLGLCCLLAAIR